MRGSPTAGADRIEQPNQVALVVGGEHGKRAVVGFGHRRVERVEHREPGWADPTKNLTPVVRGAMGIVMPEAGTYGLRRKSDAAEHGGSGYAVPARIVTEPIPWHGLAQSVVLPLPPLAALILEPA